ncbi:MAG TPA: cyclic nucleotide-binding domain-containing protein [Lamprocystis sp. (in: g-proteobacteria)]|nr:cyclic nucleotide-binding domain-containing protein [Lamprocystis sp. (in: g-proteobacteria)]
MPHATMPETLLRSVLGAELDEAEAQVLAERMEVVTLADGDVLVAEGEARRTLFLLVVGRLDVSKVVGTHAETVYQMRSGECAGTRAFVDGSTRKAALRSVGDSLVLTLEPDAFEALIDTHPRLVYKVMRAIFRITHTNLMRVNLESAELRNYLMQGSRRY